MNELNPVHDIDASRYRQAIDWLLKMNDEKVSEEDLTGWLRWCEQDVANLEAFERIQADWKDVVALRNDAPCRSSPGLRRSKPVWYALAATVLALAIGALLWTSRISGLRTQEITAHAENRIAALPDGSALTLRASSKIDYDFTPAERRVRLESGSEAFFRVRHDPARPFVVVAGDLTIEAIGTAFDVRHEARRTQVLVEEGRVRVMPREGAEAIVIAGQRFERITARDTAPHTALAAAEPAQALRWLQGQFAYDSVPLSQVVEDVNRYRTTPIEIKDEVAARIPYTGTVFVESVDDWLAALATRYPVRIRRQPNGSVELQSTR